MDGPSNSEENSIQKHSNHIGNSKRSSKTISIPDTPDFSGIFSEIKLKAYKMTGSGFNTRINPNLDALKKSLSDAIKASFAFQFATEFIQDAIRHAQMEEDREHRESMMDDLRRETIDVDYKEVEEPKQLPPADESKR